jgi:HAD superfamily hydrolase (TIGR01458 family)
MTEEESAPSVGRQLVLLDLDGTLLHAGQPIPAAAETIQALRDRQHLVRIVTNVDSVATATLAGYLRQLGFAVEQTDLVTPIVAAGLLLGSRPDARPLILANEEVADELARIATPVDLDAADQATHVIVGDVRQSLSYRMLDAGFRAVRAGAVLLALQRGRYFFGPDGAHVDTGAVVAALEYATETPATLLGKPSPDFLRQALRAAGAVFSADATWVVGDDRATDIAMANAAGLHSVQPRTGKYHDQLGRVDLPEPEQVVDSVADVPALLDRLGGGR